MYLQNFSSFAVFARRRVGSYDLLSFGEQNALSHSPSYSSPLFYLLTPDACGRLCVARRRSRSRSPSSATRTVSLSSPRGTLTPHPPTPPHLTPHTLHSTFNTPQPTLRTIYSTPQTPHTTHHTPHTTHHTLHPTHYTPHLTRPTSHTPHTTHHAPHATHHISPPALYTLHLNILHPTPGTCTLHPHRGTWVVWVLNPNSMTSPIRKTSTINHQPSTINHQNRTEVDFRNGLMPWWKA
jgi:hypothetical protein